MKKSLTIFIISLISYYLAPITYNYLYVVYLFVLFSFTFWHSIRNDVQNNQYITVTTIFGVSFFLTSFAYPVFIDVSQMAKEIPYFDTINRDYILKGTALCQFSFSAYLMGLNYQKKRNNELITILKPFSPVNYIVTPVISLIILLFGFYKATKSGSEINFDVGWSASLFTLLTIYSISVTAFDQKNYKKKTFLLIAIGIAFILLLFIIGDRGLIISIIIPLLAAYSFFIRKIKLRIIIPVLIIGIVFLSYIADTRQEATQFENINKIFQFDESSKWDYLSDLTSISRNIYIGYEYKINNASFYPIERFFIIGLSPIPFLPAYINEELADVSLQSTASIVTQFTNSKLDTGYIYGGVGTHAVIDLYISWGIVGVIIISFIFGIIVNASRQHMTSNLYSTIVYFVLLSQALYIPRSSYFVVYRLAVWALLFMFLMKKYTFVQKKSTDI